MLEGLEASTVSFKEINTASDFRIDAEFYRKIFINYEKRILSIPHDDLSKSAKFLIGPFGSSFDTENYISQGEFRYVRGQDVKPFILKDDDKKYVPKKDFERLNKYALKENDILVSVVGTLGNACLVQKDDLPSIFSCKSTVIRPEQFNPIYLLTYLNCKYGRNLLLRKERGAIQKGLNLDDLKSIVVPVFSESFQLSIAQTFSKGHKCLQGSKNLYSAAQNLLLREIGLHNWQPPQETIAVKTFKESFLQSGRLDAEYYQPKYFEIVAHIKQQNFDYLENLVNIKKSIEPGSDAYLVEGIPFLRVADLSKFGLSEPEIFLAPHKYEVSRLMPRKNDILLSKDGTVGIAYKLVEDKEVITSGAILHLSIADNRVLPDYLCLVLNSIVVQYQAERDAGGSIIQHWKPDEIKQVIIPILARGIQQKITDLVQQSFALENQSKKFLNAAKQAVEMAIDENEEIAIQWLNSQTMFNKF